MTFSGLTIKDGSTFGDGAAIDNSGGSVTVMNCVLTSNSASFGSSNIDENAPCS